MLSVLELHSTETDLFRATTTELLTHLRNHWQLTDPPGWYSGQHHWLGQENWTLPNLVKLSRQHIHLTAWPTGACPKSYNSPISTTIVENLFQGHAHSGKEMKNICPVVSTAYPPKSWNRSASTFSEENHVTPLIRNYWAQAQIKMSHNNGNLRI